MSDCQKTGYTTFIALHLLDSPCPPPEEDLEAARRHLQSCASCRTSIPPEIRARFVSHVALERDRSGLRQSGQLQRAR